MTLKVLEIRQIKDHMPVSIFWQTQKKEKSIGLSRTQNIYKHCRDLDMIKRDDCMGKPVDITGQKFKWNKQKSTGNLYTFKKTISLRIL